MIAYGQIRVTITCAAVLSASTARNPGPIVLRKQEVCTKLPHRLSLEVASPGVVREMLGHTNMGQTMDTYLVSCPTCSRRPPSVERDPNSSE
jgi:hypothetical protein